jgi:hypothetical protein
MPYFMRAIDRVHAERQLIAAFKKQMGWNDTDLFFKRLRIPRPDFGDDSFTLSDLTRGYLAGCSDDVLLDIAHQLGELCLLHRSIGAEPVAMTGAHAFPNRIVLHDASAFL